MPILSGIREQQGAQKAKGETLGLSVAEANMEAWRMHRLSLAILMAAMAWIGTAIPEDDEFRQAVNYVFSGNIEGRTPQLLSSIVDQHGCIVSVETPGNSWVYYMKEIKPDSIVIDENNRKISFEGDSTIVEHTFEGLPRIEKDNKNTITLRGDIERTKDALKVIFTKYCLPTSG